VVEFARSGSSIGEVNVQRGLGDVDAQERRRRAERRVRGGRRRRRERCERRGRCGCGRKSDHGYLFLADASVKLWRLFERATRPGRAGHQLSTKTRVFQGQVVRTAPAAPHRMPPVRRVASSSKEEGEKSRYKGQGEGASPIPIRAHP